MEFALYITTPKQYQDCRRKCFDFQDPIFLSFIVPHLFSKTLDN